MPLSRLLEAKSRFHFHITGAPKPARWCSSTPNSETEKPSPPSKRSNASKIQKEAAVETYVKEYMEMHPGVFPKATHVRNKVGGSWYTLKDILTSLKEKMFENSVRTHLTTDTSKSTLGPTESVVNSLESITGEPESTITNCRHDENNSSTSQTKDISSEDMINATSSEVTRTESYPDNADLVESTSDSLNNEKRASEAIKMHKFPDCAELDEGAPVVKLSESGVDSLVNEKDISTSDLVRIIEDNRSEGLFQSEKISNGLNLSEQEETVSDILESFDEHQNAKSEKLPSLKHNIPNEAARNLTFRLKSNLSSEVDETPASVSKAQKVTGLADLFMRRINKRAAEKVTQKKSDVLRPNGFSPLSNPTGSSMEKSSDIKGLIDCIKEFSIEQLDYRNQDSTVFNKTGQINGRDPLGVIKPPENLQSCNNKGERTLPNRNSLDKGSEVVPFQLLDEEGSDRDTASFKSTKSKSSQQFPLPSSKEDRSEMWDPSLSKKGLGQNKVLVRFLRENLNESELINAFKDCGAIVKIEFSHVKGGVYKMANVYFETREGFEKALAKTDHMVRNENITVEVASSSENVHNRISIPDLIGYHGVPTALVRNPSRTVMIKQLTHKMSSRHIEEAFAFCETRVTGFFLGSSSSVAYVEFETEDAKEEVLAQHSIVVQGKRLFILRIDAPRTTVVRISNLKDKTDLYAMCKTFGQIRTIYQRSKDIMDVHFKISEWPKMLKILNSLNGMELNGQRMVARPATAIPPDVLRILLSQPNERELVISTMHTLFRKIGENPLNKGGILDLASKFYEHDFH